MSGLPLPVEDGGERYPGFNVLSQEKYWDAATRHAVTARLRPAGSPRYFTTDELATAAALCDRLLYQEGEPRIPMESMIDARLQNDETDGWHYQDMPRDKVAWPKSLAGLDQDAHDRFGCRFREATDEQQIELLKAVKDAPDGSDWHDLRPDRVWNLWMRYACSAFYAHPWAWDEMGFAGPAYPRGYKNLGVDRLEPFEVADAHPMENPVDDPREPL